MYTNFALSVLNYFKGRMAESGQPLDDAEKQIFAQAQRCSAVFPISCLPREDLESVGYNTAGVSDSQMQHLAGKLADSYHEQLYWDNLDNLAYRYGFVKRGVADAMRSEYDSLATGGEVVTGAVVVIRHKDSNRLEQVVIALGADSGGTAFHCATDIDALCALCDPQNPHSFYIDNLISFN